MNYKNLNQTWISKNEIIEPFSYKPIKLPKVFVIGFNKTGTTSIHKYFNDNGYKSLHHYIPRDLAKRLNAYYIDDVMVVNVKNGKKLLHNIDNYNCYSDFTKHLGNKHKNVETLGQLDPSDFYKFLDLQYPNSYFILNIRDKEKWIQSRNKHRTGSIINQATRYTGSSVEEINNWWTKQYEVHIKDVEYYFKNKANLLVFNIDSDSPEKINNFLSKYYKLDAKKWGSHNEKFKN
jgi:hypothetical protein